VHWLTYASTIILFCRVNYARKCIYITCCTLFWNNLISVILPANSGGYYDCRRNHRESFICTMVHMNGYKPSEQNEYYKTTDTLSRYISHVAVGKTDTERPSRLPYVMLKESRKWKSVASFNNRRLEHCISQCSRWQRQHHVWAVKYCGMWCCVRL